MPELLFALTVAVAHAATNIDNLAVLMLLSRTGAEAPVVRAYLLAQTLVVAVAAVLGDWAAELPPGMVSLLGIVPIALGLRALWRRRRGQPEATRAAASPAGLPGLILTFLALSTDTLALLTPVMADSAPSFRLAALLGALGSIALMVGIARRVLQRATRPGAAFDQLERFAPIVMIGAGLYVLSDTATDLL